MIIIYIYGPQSPCPCFIKYSFFFLSPYVYLSRITELEVILTVLLSKSQLKLGLYHSGYYNFPDILFLKISNNGAPTTSGGKPFHQNQVSYFVKFILAMFLSSVYCYQVQQGGTTVCDVSFCYSASLEVHTYFPAKYSLEDIEKTERFRL